MRLVTIDCGAGGAPGAIIHTGEVLHLSRAARPSTVEMWLPPTVRGILDAGQQGLDTARGIVERVEGSDRILEDLRAHGALLPAGTALLAPVPEPRLVIGAGLNYRSHLAEMSGTPVPAHPTGFIKVASSITGPRAPVRVPPQASGMVDWEGELGCVIGRTCHAVGEAEALDYVAGYTVINDISARDWVRDVWAATAPWPARQTWEVNIMGKQFAGFTAIGPALVTADEVGDPADLVLETRLNGEVMQHVHTSDVIFGFAASLSYFSRWYTFHPGDILTTGTPAGVGVGRKPQRFMQAGDVIEVEVSRVGVLRNTIVA